MYNLTVQVVDQYGLKSTGPLTIELTDVNEPASIEAQSRSIQENAPEGGLLGAPIQSVDEDSGVFAVPTYTISKLEGCRGTSCFVISDALFRIEPTTGPIVRSSWLQRRWAHSLSTTSIFASISPVARCHASTTASLSAPLMLVVSLVRRMLLSASLI